MKMSKEHYSELSQLINSKLQNVPKDKILNCRNTIKFSQCQFTSFVWYIYHGTAKYEFTKELYTYLNDSHIETALKRILAEYK